jgi:hypothetical protein
MRPGQDPPRRLTGIRQSFFGLLDRAGADLLRLLPRLLAALGGTLVQETASLRGLVQEGPALVDACLLSSARPDGLVL